MIVLQRGLMRYSLGGVLLALACGGAPEALEPSAAAMPTPAATATTAATTTARPSGSFLSAELPGEVEHTSDVRKTIVGDIEQSSATAKVGDASISITASVLPGFVVAVASEDMLYRKAKSTLLATFSAKATSWDAGTQAGLPCRKLGYEADDGRKGMARLFLHDGVLVVLNAIYVEDEGVARRFLASARR